MSCPSKYATLPCSMTGVAWLKVPLTKGATQLQVHSGQGSQLPALGAGQYFFAELVAACGGCCEEVRVIARDGDKLTIERPEQSCDCFESNSRLRYTNCSVRAIRAIASETPPNVVWPLVLDCETNTIRIDCNGLHDMVNNPCGENNANRDIPGGGA